MRESVCLIIVFAKAYWALGGYSGDAFGEQNVTTCLNAARMTHSRPSKKMAEVPFMSPRREIHSDRITGSLCHFIL